MLYPEHVSFNAYEQAENMIKNIIKNERSQFPRNYFSGTDGFIRYCISIKYLIDHYLDFSTYGEMFDFFNSPEGLNFLNEYRLKVPASQFAININEALHYLSAGSPEGDLYYRMYEFYHIPTIAELKKQIA